MDSGASPLSFLSLHRGQYLFIRNSTEAMPPDPLLTSNSTPLLPSNRIRIILTHTPWSTSAGQKRLADDVGVSRSTISRLASDRIYPSLSLAQRVAAAFSARLKRPLSVDDVFSADGKWREPWGCRLCGCPGCFPD